VDEQRFVSWLQSDLHLTEKSARDVLSRLRRACQYDVDLSSPITDDELVFWMGQHPDFQQLSFSVRSQIRRAVRLARAFERE